MPNLHGVVVGSADRSTFAILNAADGGYVTLKHGEAATPHYVPYAEGGISRSADYSVEVAGSGGGWGLCKV